MVERPDKKKHREIFETAFTTFTVEGLLGEDGNGRVFDVRDGEGASWAIKCLKPAAVTRQKLKRFKNEIAFCSKMKHPNIIAVEDWGLAEISGTRVPFYVMPRFPSTLRKQMEAGIAPEEVLPLFECLLAGLEVAHAKGVWHRDLKPENILCDPAGGQLVITDFGIAHFAEPLLQTPVETSSHERVGNFQYAAPEQRTCGEIDHRADIYALGLILNEMFTGKLLQGTGHQTIGSVAAQFAHLDVLVDRLVRQSPDQRPTSIDEVRAGLSARPVLVSMGREADKLPMTEIASNSAPIEKLLANCQISSEEGLRLGLELHRESDVVDGLVCQHRQ